MIGTMNNRWILFAGVAAIVVSIAVLVAGAFGLVHKARNDVTALGLGDAESVVLSGVVPDRSELVILTFTSTNSDGRFTAYWSLRRYQPIGAPDWARDNSDRRN